MLLSLVGYILGVLYQIMEDLGQPIPKQRSISYGLTQFFHTLSLKFSSIKSYKIEPASAKCNLDQFL